MTETTTRRAVPLPETTIATLRAARARFDNRIARERHADTGDAVARVRAFLNTCDSDGIDDDTPLLDAVGYDLTPRDLRALLTGEATGPDERPEGYDLFAHVTDITAWLDASNADSLHEDSMRVLKLTEEAGEAAAAYIGMVGQNPRKGITHTLDDLLSELADVALTALCAIQHFTRDQQVTRTTLTAKTHRIITRSDIPHTRP